MPQISFSWNGLPQYAARLLRGALDAVGRPCDVIGSRPTVAVEGMEHALAYTSLESGGLECRSRCGNSRVARAGLAHQFHKSRRIPAAKSKAQAPPARSRGKVTVRA